MTVFEGIVLYCEDNHKCIVDIHKRREIGELVKKKWYKITSRPLPTTKANQLEPDGMEYNVIRYPEYFSPYIREVVEEFYQNLRNNRKKIPIRQSSTYKGNGDKSHAA